MFKRNFMKAMLKEINKTDFTCGCTNNLDDFKVSYITNGKNIDKIEVECYSIFNGNNMR